MEVFDNVQVVDETKYFAPVKFKLVIQSYPPWLVNILFLLKIVKYFDLMTGCITYYFCHPFYIGFRIE